ncbi:Cap-specific mRNA (nucleoside-2'-O-)-methyltransferase 2 [Chionoecetes opilio]|uniref:Cap-specific mRNA (nucleoside-2'-O-)-methyltransferase 2 n=1 Tax=Chionoecetes opilio TaxID=41210 RepID=A0A8J8WMG5_CHIOP|nr:Cap-specific mRNA (nucleoside-2'-O-)-methyltransferase 2 [Chionoecetes opilio]
MLTSPKMHTMALHSGGPEGNKYPLLEYPDQVQVQMEAEEHFNKRFTFTPPPAATAAGWRLPPAPSMYTAPLWQKEELQEMKVSLNQVKQQLGGKDIAVWHAHTTNTNPSQRVCHAVKRRAQPEMLTQAWLKFYEIVNGYPIVPPAEEGEGEAAVSHAMKGEEEGGTAFTSLHLCEAPGAFISALNHYLALNRPALKWQWLGTTLNPYYEGVPLSQCVVDDRLISHTLPHWCFGADNTGDLTQRHTLHDLAARAARAASLGAVQLVTADGSFDCQRAPAEQERDTHPLHLCEAAAALTLLAPGGSLVLKKFTLFESETLCLVYLLCCVFGRVHVYKPATSKQGNSEVYLVCLHYRGHDHFTHHLERLVAAAWPGQAVAQAMFREEDVPRDFLEQVKECSSLFMAHQANSIQRNLQLFEDASERQKQLNELLKAKATTLFFERNYCAPIAKWQTLSQGRANQPRPLLDSDWNKVASAMLVRSHTPAAKLQVLTTFLAKFAQDYADGGEAEVKGGEWRVSSFPGRDAELLGFEVIRGKPVQCIESSKFCSERILRVTRELQLLWETEACSSSAAAAAWPCSWTTCGGPAGRGVAAGGSVVVVGAPLLSRLQYGLLLALSCAFREVLVYRSVRVGGVLPVVVLQGLRGREAAAAVVGRLRGAGWQAGGPGVGEGQAVVQVVGLASLLQEGPLMSVYQYNVHLCGHLAHAWLAALTPHPASDKDSEGRDKGSDKDSEGKGEC